MTGDLTGDIQDVLTHYSWLLHYRCFLHQVHNTTTCQEVLGFLGPCIEAIGLAFELPSVENSVTAQNICLRQLSGGDTHGILIEDIRKRVSKIFSTGVYLLFSGNKV